MANCVYCGADLTLVPDSTAIAKTVANTAKAVNNDGRRVYEDYRAEGCPRRSWSLLTVIVDLSTTGR